MFPDKNVSVQYAPTRLHLSLRSLEPVDCILLRQSGEKRVLLLVSDLLLFNSTS
ncbi:hypothetical protein J2Z81_002567 [Virgibacillus campisalis]|uniref:Uncharacterized protein n=1 Tax=Virgibacillus alimentarius TaxID=698769 RepID=A0ABS4SAP6_9BACI|nr:hypothetical protein [Virgibacillus sp.]MBP2258584.1 hypothetical protein [Virgibacillus alimentarius]HLR68424.1 hypothetical protein [Virgibacillus sp.]